MSANVLALIARAPTATNTTISLHLLSLPFHFCIVIILNILVDMGLIVSM